MATAVKADQDLGTLVAEVAAGLASAEFWQGRAYIRTPVLLPTGSTVVVVIEKAGPGTWHLTDLGQGLELAVDLGIERGYRQHAEAMAAKSGIAFKRDTFLVHNLRRDQLAAGIAFLADAVAKSLDRARIAASDRSRATDVERLATRLGGIFEPKHVKKNAELQGASTHQWRLDALVETDGRTAAFDLVTPHPSSVAATTTKFHYLARLDQPPRPHRHCPEQEGHGRPPRRHRPSRPRYRGRRKRRHLAQGSTGGMRANAASRHPDLQCSFTDRLADLHGIVTQKERALLARLLG